MHKFKERVIEQYNRYKEFDAVVKTLNDKLKDKSTNFKDIVKSLEDENGIEEIKKMYSDSIIANAQLRLHFENLIFFIKTYLESGEEDLEEQILNFYNESIKYKSRVVFAVEKGVLVPTDEDLYEEARKSVNESPLMKMVEETIKTSAPS